ncbi:TonB-dependent receptor [Rhodopila sp.]|uniref:TonB-dependent receptor n=1 Tax=Rhodopila sp. TaxID=2480087 RepID=UPI002CFAB2E3|nr:TonB-dependent receptor [Rhodopila sp.]HVZ07814.1 TonB-dependent receptor [Rhodopila sp.]
MPDGAVSFRIPAGPLDQALAAFGSQSGYQLIYDSGLTAGRASAGSTGSMPPWAALQRLLSGTGLVAQQTGDHAISLIAEPSGGETGMVLPPVEVEGQGRAGQGILATLPPVYAGGQVATGGQVGLLGNRGVMDTPYSQTSYTAPLLRDQQARTVMDALLNQPSARDTWSSQSYTNALTIRGFPVSSWDFSFNGQYGVVPGLAFDAGSIERVEVLNGPSALLNGMPPLGSIGGSVNLVPKRAEDDPITRLTATYATNSQFGGQIDIGRRFGDNKEWGVRLNATYRDGNTSTHNQSQSLESVALATDYRGDHLRVSLDLGYQNLEVQSPLRPTYVAAGVAIPRAPSAGSNWFQPWTYAHAQDWYGALRAEYDITDNWTVFAAVGGRQDNSYLLSGFATINNVNGNLTEAPYNFPVVHNTDSQQGGIRGRFETGPVRHEVSLTADRVHDAYGSLFPVVATIASNLYTPTFIPEPLYPNLTAPITTANTLTSVGAADVMSILDQRVSLIWGLRQQEIASRNYSSSTGALTSKYDKGALTPSVGLVVKPWRNVSLYTSYIQGLQQGGIVGIAYANAGQVLPPFVSKQYEVGAKVDWGTVTSTLALFQITQAGGSVDTATNVYTADGEQRNRGIELNNYGQLTDQVRILGGVTFLQGELVSTSGGANNGHTAPGVPNVQLNVGGEWDTPFVPGLTLTGRVIYTSRQYYDNANTQQIPGWVRFDLGARYTFDVRGQPITIRGNIINVANAGYWAAANPTYGLSLGMPRTFLLSTSIQF